MVPGVPREAQQLVCVCANEFGGAADCGEYRQAAGAVFTNFLSVELGPLRCNAAIKTLAST
jgi:hypothetical protein